MAKKHDWAVFYTVFSPAGEQSEEPDVWRNLTREEVDTKLAGLVREEQDRPDRRIWGVRYHRVFGACDNATTRP